jgi:uncharacterized OB-fold protein
LSRFTESGLVGGECPACDNRHFPAASFCPWCGAEGVVEVALSTTGTLWTWTAVTARPPGYEGPVPFGFGVVDLPADGLRVVTRLTVADPVLLHLGDPMAFCVVDVADGLQTWAFAPVGGDR